MVYVYALKLESGKYYIGRTNNPKFRMQQHFDATGSEWTKKYPPIKVLECFEVPSAYFEDPLTITYMNIYGIDNVRCGSFCQFELDKMTIKTINKMISNADDKCFKCGKDGHYSNKCPQNKIVGYTKPVTLNEMPKKSKSKAIDNPAKNNSQELIDDQAEPQQYEISPTINEDINDYLECLRPERCEIRESWLKIGMVIFNEGGSFETFDTWSQKCPHKYSLIERKEAWNSFDTPTEKKVKFATLKMQARDDNIRRYNYVKLKHDLRNPKLSRDQKFGLILDKMYETCQISDTMLALLFHTRHPHNFAFDDKNGNKKWFSLNEYNIYVEESSSVLTMRGMMNNDLSKIIEEDAILRINKYDRILENNKTVNAKRNEPAKVKGKNKNKVDGDNQELDNNTPENVEDILEKIKEINKFSLKMTTYIETATKKDQLVKELTIMYRNPGFYQRLDSLNPYLFAFSNGVYDIKNNIFRLPTPDEMISCTTGYEYREPQDKYINELNNLFRDIFPNTIERDYALMILSTSIIGKIIQESFVFFIGSGGNGKGIITELLNLTLGGYFGTLDSDYFNKKDCVRSSAPNDNLAKCKNSRWVNVSEIESGIKFKDNRLKQLSGGDKIITRTLYGHSFEYIPKFTLCFQCNELPEIDGSDGGIKRRLKYINFRTKFVENPKNADEKPIVNNLKSKLRNDSGYKYAFFSILLKNYYVLKNERNMNLDIPVSFQSEINKYISDNDPVGNFVKTRLEKTGIKKDIIRSSELYEEFVKYTGDNSVSNKKFIANLKKHDIEISHTKDFNCFRYLKYIDRSKKNQNDDDIDDDQ